MRHPSKRILIQTASIYPATSAQDRGGGPSMAYATSPTYSAVPCSAQAQGWTETWDQGVLTQVRDWLLIFGQAIQLRNRDKIVFATPDGVSHTVYVSATRDPGGRGGAWSVRATERAAT